MRIAEPGRAAQAVAVTAVGVPSALLAHLLTTGRPPGDLAAGLTTAVVLVVAAGVRVRSTGAFALLTGLTQLAAHTVLAFLAGGAAGGPSGCLPAVGRAASLGLHLTVLRTEAACPPGAIPLAPSVAALVAALMTAAAIVSGHAVVAAVAGRLLRRALDARALLACLARVVERVMVRTAALVALLGRPRPPTTPPARPRPQVRSRRAPVTAWIPGTTALRAPPAHLLPAV